MKKLLLLLSLCAVIFSSCTKEAVQKNGPTEEPPGTHLTIEKGNVGIGWSALNTTSTGNNNVAIGSRRAVPDDVITALRSKLSSSDISTSQKKIIEATIEAFGKNKRNNQTTTSSQTVNLVGSFTGAGIFLDWDTPLLASDEIIRLSAIVRIYTDPSGNTFIMMPQNDERVNIWAAFDSQTTEHLITDTAPIAGGVLPGTYDFVVCGSYGSPTTTFTSAYITNHVTVIVP